MKRNILKGLRNRWRRWAWPGDQYARSLGVTVGERCRILTRSFSTEPYLIRIGDDVTISTNVLLLTHDGSTWLFRDAKGRRYDYRRIDIGNRVFIGANAIIMPGVRIGDRVIVGAGSVVTKSIPEGLVVAGNPARCVGHFDHLEERALNEYPRHDEIDSKTQKEFILDNSNTRRKGWIQ